MRRKKVAEEHAEYEAVIHQVGGMTISEVEARIIELLARCRTYKERYGATSWQYKEQIEEVKRGGRIYKVVVARHPRLRQILAADVEASSSARPPPPPRSTSSAGLPSSRPSISLGGEPSSSVRRTDIVERLPAKVYRRERELRSMRGRSARGRSRSLARGRGPSGGRLSIDSLMDNDFVERWLSFSRRARESS